MTDGNQTMYQENNEGLATKERWRIFLLREWPYLALVLFAAALLVFALLMPPATFVGQEEVMEETSGGPTTMELMARLDRMPSLKSALYLCAGVGVVLFFAGLPLLGYFLWRHAGGQHLLGCSPGVRMLNWGIWDVLKSAALYFLLLQAGGGLVGWLAPDQALGGPYALGLIFVANLLITVFIFRQTGSHGMQSTGALALRLTGFFKRLWQGMVGYVAFFPVLVGLALTGFLLGNLIGLEAEQNPLVPMVLQSDSRWFLIFLLFFGALVGPVTEEIFFRGFLYPPLRRRVGRVPAILISAFCFAALHGNLIQLLPIFGLGVILALLRERTGSLIPSIALHCGHNLAVLSLLFILRPVLL